MNDGRREIYSDGMGSPDGAGPSRVVDGQTTEGDCPEGSTKPLGGKAKEGYVYFIETEDEQFIKIGFSVRPTMRLQRLSTNNPFRLTLLGFMPGSRVTERYLHRRFKADQVNGEWFRSSDEIRRMINGLGLLTEWADDAAREWQPPEELKFIERKPEEVVVPPRARRMPRDPHTPKNAYAVELASLRWKKQSPEII